ncbi:ankyrin repeat-containing protein BDA1-like [Momordica charantia]|uniref:Ankyrin repeat-containing protein BDA1-like n=1 Tax=Momordica charantia TaxID=3673 RepID=A0A6J1BQE2_MOMCH|nr:ankyrin repeat-containing protein BDA1-like [Momordica charantia]
MAGIERSSRLQEAAMEGNVTILLELLQQDPLLLDRVNDFTETPLHVAALLGHVSFVDELLNRRPQLAGELDSGGSSALHLAAAKGFVEIVKRLVAVDANLCLLSDGDGRNPVHVAAMRGRVAVLAELVRARPAAARTAVDGGGTVLHLCVKYNQLEALRILVETVAAADDSFVNAKDDYGFTVLHLAVSIKQLQTVRYLINDTGIEVNAVNSNGLTALDILTQSHRDLKDMDIAAALTSAGANRSKNGESENQIKPKQSSSHENESWLTRKREALMVVASLIATMAFQAGVSPPGGVWQDDKASGKENHTAGTSIMAGKDPLNYNRYVSWNTTGFTASLIVIILLSTGLPYRNPIFLWVLILKMWVAVSSMGITYGISLRFFTPGVSQRFIYVAFAVFAAVCLLLLGKIVQLITRQLMKLNYSCLCRRRTPAPAPDP